jgi:hypothetical protein
MLSLGPKAPLCQAHAQRTGLYSAASGFRARLCDCVDTRHGASSNFGGVPVRDDTQRCHAASDGWSEPVNSLSTASRESVPGWLMNTKETIPVARAFVRCKRAEMSGPCR